MKPIVCDTGELLGKYLLDREKLKILKAPNHLIKQQLETNEELMRCRITFAQNYILLKITLQKLQKQLELFRRDANLSIE